MRPMNASWSLIKLFSMVWQQRASVPADASYGFLGNAGDLVWVLPQEEQEGVLYAGIAGDEIESGIV